MIRERENQQAKGDPNRPIRCVALNEDQITQMRKENTSCDLAIADALGCPAAVTVWTAHGQRSSLFIVVITPKEGSDEEPSVSVDYVDGGTEWDRKQKLRALVEESVQRGKELGFQARCL